MFIHVAMKLKFGSDAIVCFTGPQKLTWGGDKDYMDFCHILLISTFHMMSLEDQRLGKLSGLQSAESSHRIVNTKWEFYRF